MKTKFSDIGEWFKIAEVLLIIVVAPTAIFFIFSLHLPIVLDISYYFLVTILVIQAAIAYLHAGSVFRRKRFHALPSAKKEPLPRTTFIVVAYLPNETEIIESTLTNILQKVERPQDGIEVILSYNTPHMEELELKLRDMAIKWPELILANAHNSRSKSQNLNYAIELASGKMIVLIDSDHLLDADCLKKAWRWLDEGYDVVQGRCKVSNATLSLISRIVDVEFEIIYGIHHTAKSIIFDSALFGGSNGYWKSSVVKDIKFSEGMLTEDIDATLRTLLAGYRIVHDRSIISRELAPTRIKSLWLQRKRWAQGWFECSFKYQLKVWRSKYFNFGQKFLWTTLLSWRVAYDVLSMLLFPVLFAYWLILGKIVLPVNAYIIFALFFTLLSGPFHALAAFRNAAKPRASAFWYILYAFGFWPYTVFKSVVNLVAIRDELSGERKWISTARDKR
ncbi:MAG: glycosyltransferase family 2 protein [Candidatus Omnitrophica bacterium]|nr:glycosyltransferase family 2 protein [Candidatus Omnitrophota bacterium]